MNAHRQQSSGWTEVVKKGKREEKKKPYLKDEVPEMSFEKEVNKG